MGLTNEEKGKVTKDVLGRLVFLCKLHQLDYLTMSKDMQNLLLECFLDGVAYIKQATDTLKNEVE